MEEREGNKKDRKGEQAGKLEGWGLLEGLNGHGKCMRTWACI
jgi:hypothetical protein